MGDKFGVLVIDPFRGLDIPDIHQKNYWHKVAFPLKQMKADSVVILWCGLNGQFLLDGTTEALLSHWGYDAKQLHTWFRKHDGFPLPAITNEGVSTAEQFIIAARGYPNFKHLGEFPYATSVYQWEAGGQSYRKPDAFYNMIECVFDGPYATMYLPHKRVKWTNL